MFSGLKTVHRFSLLLLEEGENYLQEYLVECTWPASVKGDLHSKGTLPGALRLCTKSFFFEPDDARIPVVRFPFRYVQYLEPGINKSFTMTTTGLTKMKANNMDMPYVHLRDTESKWNFTLLYAVFDKFFNLVMEQMAMKDNEELLQIKMQERVEGASFDASRLVSFGEKIVVECPAVHIQPLIRDPGKLVVTNLRIYFQPLTNISGITSVYTHPLEHIAAVSRRRSSLRPCGLEVLFLPSNVRAVWNSPCAFFELRSQEEREFVMSLLLDKIRTEGIPGGVLESEGEWLGRVSIAWQLGQISNFDYILYLNLASGRTFNDLRQWPVFPWVLQDYKSEVLDLENPQSYRDLSKPIGALNPDRLDTLKKRFYQMPVDGFPPRFLYGTHYSTPGYVMFWLVRAAPAHILQLQSGRFDSPDRMFCSISEAWDSVTTNPADVKELIPEFYLPNTDFLINKFHLALGTRQNGKPVGDVELPPWAEDPIDFLAKNRSALESEHVSKSLHNWIDLIFGYKQTGEAAVKADNVFYYLCYEGAVDIESVEDPLERKSLQAQINEFGQTPKQLFDHPHLPRQVIPPTPDPSSVFEFYSHSPTEGQSIESRVVDLEKMESQTLSLAIISLVCNIVQSDTTKIEIRTPLPLNKSSSGPVKKPDTAPDRPDGLNKQQSIYDRVKEEYGFKDKGELRKSVSNRLRGLSSGLNRFVESFNAKLMPPNRPSLGDPWEALLGGMQLRHNMSFLHGAVKSIAISELDGGTLYCVGDNATMKMFSLETGNQIRSARIEKDSGKGIPLSDLDLMPHKRPNMHPLALVGSYDNSVYVYSHEFGRLIGLFGAHDDSVSVVKVINGANKACQLVTASWDESVKVWRIHDGRAPWEGTSQNPDPEICIRDHEAAVVKVAVSGESEVVVAGTVEGSTVAWDLRSPGRPIWRVNRKAGRVGGLCLLPDGEHVICGYADQTVRLWSVKRPDQVVCSVECPSGVHCCLSDGVVALMGQDNGKILQWNVGRVLGRSHVVQESSLVSDGDGFFTPLECPDQSGVNAICVNTVTTIDQKDVLWVAAGQDNGAISVFSQI